MKIHNNSPISNQEIRKSKRTQSSNRFGQLLESELESSQPVAPATPQHDEHQQPPSREAWQTLEQSVSLLDRAMQRVEEGNIPSPELIQDIEQMRAKLRQQLQAGSHNHELNQADTLLAVEAERIRAMQS